RLGRMGKSFRKLNKSLFAVLLGGWGGSGKG
ncbi:MAG: hypothetical protein JWP84_4225, partial [Tardiphaga sp.]|nr:hypothetical protein [Tardiphaga sp.]